MSAFVNGWTLEIEVQMGYDPSSDRDCLELRLTGGSNGGARGNTIRVYAGDPLDLYTAALVDTARQHA